MSERARIETEKLFPGRESSLQRTDPELVDLFNTFALDEILHDTHVDDRTRLLTQLAALIGAGALTEFGIMLQGALNIGVEPAEVKEVLYQAVPLVGMGPALDFIYRTNEVLRTQGVITPLEGQSTVEPAGRDLDGLAMYVRWFGEPPLDATASPTADDDRRSATSHFIRYFFGDISTRSGLAESERALASLMVVVGLGGAACLVQRFSRAARRLGVPGETIVAALRLSIPFIGFGRYFSAMSHVDADIDS